MPNKYQVKIKDSILPQLYTFDQLIDAGLLDEVDERIKVKLNGDSAWFTARSFPFSVLENKSSTRNDLINEKKYEFPTQMVTNPVHVNSNLQSPNRPFSTEISQLQQECHPIVDTWNWGAFSLSWLWGVFNGLYWPLIIIVLNFIPYIGIIISLCVCFFLGNRGNELAWRIARKKGIPIEYFVHMQIKWNTAGIIVTVVSILFAISLFLSHFCQNGVHL